MEEPTATPLCGVSWARMQGRGKEGDGRGSAGHLAEEAAACAALLLGLHRGGVLLLGGMGGGAGGAGLLRGGGRARGDGGARGGAGAGAAAGLARHLDGWMRWWWMRVGMEGDGDGR